MAFSAAIRRLPGGFRGFCFEEGGWGGGGLGGVFFWFRVEGLVWRV